MKTVHRGSCGKPRRTAPAKITFELSPGQVERLRQWEREINYRLAVRQVAAYDRGERARWMCEGTIARVRASIERGDPQPYAGAIGGGLTFCFTPTSIGVAVDVTNAQTGEKLDLTDYDEW